MGTLVPSFVFYVVLPEAMTIGILVSICTTLGWRVGTVAWFTALLSIGTASWALMLYYTMAPNAVPTHAAYVLTATSGFFAVMTQTRNRFVWSRRE
jgi:uncharacterized membrane protein required for colicin V production